LLVSLKGVGGSGPGGAQQCEYDNSSQHGAPRGMSVSCPGFLVMCLHFSTLYRNEDGDLR
ncbi:MAG TPA: hypothetical protein VFE01_05885, partial [Terracidiphilus sp.]|nr:hypothetical protein [Terracidiphilus sp.]